jgi:hypothetical protein
MKNPAACSSVPTSALTIVHSIVSIAHLHDPPLQAQVRHQRFCMAGEAHVAMRAFIISPAVYTRVRQVEYEEIAQVVDAAACRPCHSSVSVQAMDCHDALVGITLDRAIGEQGHTLNYWVDALRYRLQALCNRFCRDRGCRTF